MTTVTATTATAINFLTHLLVPSDCKWDKEKIADYMVAVDPRFQPVSTETGIWLTDKQADVISPCLDSLAIEAGFPEEERAYLSAEMGLTDSQAEEVQSLLDEMTEYQIRFSHSWDDGVLWSLSRGAESYDDWGNEIGEVTQDNLPTEGLK